MLRFGRVSSVDAAKHTVQVVFEDVDPPYVSHDLHVLVLRRGDYSLPAARDLVACAMNDGPEGEGVVLGVMYSDSDEPPTDEVGARVLAGDDTRLGSKDATDAVALAPAVAANFDAQKTHFDALWLVVSGPPIVEAGNGAPSAFQAALAVALGTSPYPTPDDTGAEMVTAK